MRGRLFCGQWGRAMCYVLAILVMLEQVKWKSKHGEGMMLVLKASTNKAGKLE